MNSKTLNVVALVLGALVSALAALEAYLASGQPITWTGGALAIGTALLGYAVKRSGDVTKSEAEKLADARARDHVIAYRAMADTHLPPAFPDDPATPD